MDPQTKSRWVALAESLTPQLRRQVLPPTAVVLPERDPSAFQSWRMAPAGTFAELAGRTLHAGASFVLDFGEHLVGTLDLAVETDGRPADAPLRLAFVFGEVPAEVAEPLDPYNGTLSRSWLQDEVLNLDVLPQRLELPRRYAFRYVKITIAGCSPWYAVRITSIQAIAVSSAEPLQSVMRHDLPADLAPLDRVALRTLRNCMQTVFEDGPKRDRRLWLGDLRLEALANYVSFKHYSLVKRGLYLLAGLARDDGLVPACVYERPGPASGGVAILDYAVLFGPTLLEYFQASGDRATADELFPVARRQLDFPLKHLSDAGVFQDPGSWWIFIDWNERLDKQAAMHAVTVYAIGQVLELARLLDRAKEVCELEKILARMHQAAQTHLRDGRSGLYLSGPARQLSWASQAWMVLAGIMTPEEGRAAFEQLPLLRDALRPAGPYLYHYVVEAMVRCGMRSAARQLLLDYWGQMIALGASTFWEVFDPNDHHLSPYRSHLVNSYCHAWSATPTYLIRKLLIDVSSDFSAVKGNDSICRPT